MKGKFFGYKQIDPCPHCGTPRVGADYDDDYYVIPGNLKEPCQWSRNGEVTISVHSPQIPSQKKNWVRVLVQGTREEDGVVLVGATLDKFNFYVPAQEQAPSTEELKEHLQGWECCPDCGATLEFDSGEKLGNVTTFIGRCPQKDTQEEIERLPGCAKCATSAHGGHFVD